MNEEIKMPVVTEDDILAGEKEITVAKRSGGTRTIKIKPLSWRAALKANADLASGRMDDAAITILPQCLSRADAKDESLDGIIPAHLFWITSTAMQLSNGVDAAKKTTAASQSTSPTTTPPNAN